MKFNRSSTRAKAPVRASSGSNGYDLYLAKRKVIKAFGNGLINTDTGIIIPEGTSGRIAPCSGLMLKNSIGVGADLTDSDLREMIGVGLFNHSSNPYQIEVGDRITQLILEKMEIAKVIEVDE